MFSHSKEGTLREDLWPRGHTHRNNGMRRRRLEPPARTGPRPRHIDVRARSRLGEQLRAASYGGPTQFER
jgi:hypothetical protein